jgi:hypothetical protein
MWERKFHELEKFHSQKGHCLVNVRHRQNGLNLGQWVAWLRSTKNRLTEEQINRFDKLAFSWNPRDELWDPSFAALLKFYKREGSCRVPLKHEEDGLKIGIWVCFQRSKKDRLTTDQIKRLDALGFSWDPHKDLWEINFAALMKYYTRTGDCRAPRSHTEDGLNLGAWLKKQRQKKSKLTKDQIKRLNALGFVWKA